MSTAARSEPPAVDRSISVQRLAVVFFVLALIVLLYWDVVPGMVSDWWTDEGSSHGLLVFPLALYIAWHQRRSVLSEPVLPESRGLLCSILACGLYVAGRLGAEFFLTRVSLIVLLAGLTWTFWGRGRLRKLAFPILLLVTMVPLPTILYNQLAGPLQLLASKVATDVARSFGVAVFRDGNVIHLADTTLGVAEACSGLRSLSSLLIGALLLGYLDLRRPGTRIALFVLAIPVAILTNVIRVAGTAILADANPDLGTGFYHIFSGWLIFLTGLGMLLLALKALKVLFESRR